MTPKSHCYYYTLNGINYLTTCISCHFAQKETVYLSLVFIESISSYVFDRNNACNLKYKMLQTNSDQDEIVRIRRKDYRFFSP